MNSLMDEKASEFELAESLVLEGVRVVHHCESCFVVSRHPLKLKRLLYGTRVPATHGGQPRLAFHTIVVIENDDD